MRAFRPSHFALDEDCSEEVDKARQENVLRYAKRVQNGLPLFNPRVLARELNGMPDRHVANG